jgi:FkbM family methyltransferase
MDTVLWFRSVIRPGMTVIDVGANVGQMTLEMAELVGPKGRVIAIEPGSGNLALLRRHVEGNGYGGRVTIVEAACGSTHGGECELTIVGERPDEVGSGFQVMGLGLLSTDVGSPRTTARVRCVSVDGLCRELDLRPSLLKIDVEGSEVEVFRGAAKVLAEFRPIVRFGFHPFAFAEPRAAQQAILDILKQTGLNPPNSSHDRWGLEELNVSAE